MVVLKSILLTGGTGNVGAQVLDQLLSGGYKVTAVIRSLKKSSPFLTHKYASHVESGSLVLVEIPDLTVPHAFDDLAKKVDAIIHVATPLSDTDFEKAIIAPTAVIDDSVLSAAAASGSVKRVIITGSIVSTLNVPDGLFQDITVSADTYNTSTHEQGVASAASAYVYAKTAAEKKAWAFMEREKPAFDLVVLLAPSILGRCIQNGFVPKKSALGGQGGLYRGLFDVEKVGFLFPHWMDVEDVATIHVRSLDLEKVPGNERYLFYTRPLLNANEIANKVREAYPQLRNRVPKGGEGDGLEALKAKIDIEKSEKVFGTQWKDWWYSVKGTVEDILKYEGQSK